MQLRKWFTYSLAVLLLLSANTAKPVDAPRIKWIEISRVHFAISTIVSITCGSFMDTFGNRVEKISVHNKAALQKFSELLRGLAISKSQIPPDTRAKVLIHFEGARVGTLCVGISAISLNGNLMEPADDMVRYIEDYGAPQNKRINGGHPLN